MADTKVSELTSATSVGGSDVFYVVQSNTSKKVTAATLFANAGNTILKGTTTLNGVQILATPGIIDTTKHITQFSSDAAGGSVSLPAGSDGQLKVLVMTATAGGAYTVVGNVANSANIVFNAIGDTATLLYTNNKWFMIGGTATLS